MRHFFSRTFANSVENTGIKFTGPINELSEKIPSVAIRYFSALPALCIDYRVPKRNRDWHKRAIHVFIFGSSLKV